MRSGGQGRGGKQITTFCVRTLWMPPKHKTCTNVEAETESEDGCIGGQKGPLCLSLSSLLSEAEDDCIDKSALNLPQTARLVRVSIFAGTGIQLNPMQKSHLDAPKHKTLNLPQTASDCQTCQGFNLRRDWHSTEHEKSAPQPWKSFKQ